MEFDYDDAVREVRYSYWFDVKYGQESTHAFTVGPPLSQSAGLFGRGTVVCSVSVPGHNKPFALKDPWQECNRKAEYSHYDTLTIHRDDNTPLADCVGSIDLGKEKTDQTVGYKTHSVTHRIGDKHIGDKCGRTRAYSSILSAAI